MQENDYLYTMQSRLSVSLRRVLLGHVLVPFWWSRKRRRDRRYEVYGSVVPQYFRERYVPGAVVAVSDPASGFAPLPPAEGREKMFTLWLQGEGNAPALVKKCFALMRRRCPEFELVILDRDSLREWTDIPDYIWRKLEEGRMTMAQFSDICRLDLLYRHGGVWIDSTCFVTSGIPQDIKDCGFFAYRAGHSLNGYYSFIQSCFLRARRGSHTVAAWRAVMWEFWKRENSKIDYYQVHLMLKALVEADPAAAAEFDAMPAIDQDPTHLMWFTAADKPYDTEAFRQACSEVFFQKTSFRIGKVIEGSNKEYILNYEV